MSEHKSSSAVSTVAWNWRHSEQTAADSRQAASRARREGLIRALIGFTIAALLYLWKPTLGMVAGGLTAFILLLALVAPLTAYRALTQGLAVFALWVARLVTWVLMTGLYFLFVTPAGWLLRAFGRLRLTFGAEAERTSYWEKSPEIEASLAPYRRQF
ncbi:MAG: hypothetical protein AAF481_05810 [Acidobacteriota bacterium]